MIVSELPAKFEFIFLEEIEDVGFAYTLTKHSPYVYLSESMRDLLLENFDQTFEEMLLMDFSEANPTEINIPALRLLRIKEEMHFGVSEEEVKTIADL